MPKCNGVVKEGAMHKNVAVKTDEKKRWRIEVLNKVTRHIRLDFHRNPVNSCRGATSAARAPKPDKTPITWRRAAAATAVFYFATSR